MIVQIPGCSCTKLEFFREIETAHHERLPDRRTASRPQNVYLNKLHWAHLIRHDWIPENQNPLNKARKTEQLGKTVVFHQENARPHTSTNTNWKK